MTIIPVAEVIKNTTEALNYIYEIYADPFTQMKLYSIVLRDTLYSSIAYIARLQWINDFIKFPIVVPQTFESIFLDFFHAYPNDLNLIVTDTKNLIQSNLFLSFFYGFFNCLFFYFPSTSIHLIWLRRLVVNGKWAGRAAAIGFVFGNISLLSIFLFGFRDIVNFWYGLEPISYFVGVWLIFVVVFEITNTPLKIIRKSKKKELLKISFINFILVWTDQSGMYQCFGNLSFHNGTSIIDLANSNLTIPIYFIGIIFGSFFWAMLYNIIFSKLGYLLCNLTRCSYSFWIKGFNNFCLVTSTALTIASFTYYGPDYLFSSPLGFVSQDSVFERLPIPKLSVDTKDAYKGRLGEKSALASLDTDITIFDRARYAGGPSVESHIESLNYQEEYAWRSRYDKLSSKGLNRGTSLLGKYIKSKSDPLKELQIRQERREKKFQQDLQKARKHAKRAKLPSKKILDLIDLNSKNFYKLDPNNLSGYYESLIERFVEDYSAEANKNDPEVPDLIPERMIHFSAFSEIVKYSFDLFSMFENPDLSPNDNQISAEFKEKFSNNLIYKSIINLDIPNFLKRQPKDYKLTSFDEISLFYKRLALSEYYDTLRSYSKIPYNEIFRKMFCGPKSYSNRIYNQQFKGTLKIVERLFSIHLEEEENIPALPSEETKRKQMSKEEMEYFKLTKEPSPLKYDQPLYKKKFIQKNPLVHEEFLKEAESVIEEADNDPFLKEENPLPFFVGWDNDKRKFVITNRLLDRKNTFSYGFPLMKDENMRDFSSFKGHKKTYPTLYVVTQLGYKLNPFYYKPIYPLHDTAFNLKQNEKFVAHKFEFTTWPVSEKKLNSKLFFSKLFRTREEMFLFDFGDDLFKYLEPLMEEAAVIYDKLPNLIERVESKNPEKLKIILVPKRGGFFWPGDNQFKLKPGDSK